MLLRRCHPGTLDQRALRKIYKEANIMSMIPQHPNVVRYFGTVLEKPNYALILEFCCVPAIWEGAASSCALAHLLGASARCRQQQPRGNESNGRSYTPCAGGLPIYSLRQLLSEPKARAHASCSSSADASGWFVSFSRQITAQH